MQIALEIFKDILVRQRSVNTFEYICMQMTIFKLGGFFTMKENAIKEIYKSTYGDLIMQCSQEDALKLQEIEGKLKKKLNLLEDKANSEETKAMIGEIKSLSEELNKNLKEVAFVKKKKKGAQIMGSISE